MELALAVVACSTGARADVVVRAPAGTSLRQVAPQLLATVLPAGATGTLCIHGEALAAGALLGQPPLVHGALLAVDDKSDHGPGLGLLDLRVVGGPDAGGVHRLAPGTVVVGRSAAARIDDPDISREHFRLTVGHDGATVEDMGSTNGTWIDDRRIDGPVPLAVGARLRAGSTTIELHAPAPPPMAVVPTGDGALGLNRPPRIRPAHDVVQVFVPEPPAEHDRNPIPLLAVVAPLVLGVVMWRVMGNASFLLFTLLSPVMVIGNVISDRRAGRRRSRRQRVLWRAQRDVAEATLRAAVLDDEQERRAAAPDAAELLLAARGPRPALWARRRADDDFLALRVGVADQPARVEAEGDVTAEMTTARAVPVTVSLTETGVLGVAGGRARAEALARWLVVQAATLHSPRDLQIVVIAEPAAAAAWEWVGVLPHLHPDAHQRCRATIGLGTRQAAARVAELAALVEGRRAELAAVMAPARSDDRPVLLVVDGARALRATPGLTSLLTDGPSVGVFTIALDRHVQLLPEECGATAVLGEGVGATADLDVVAAAPLLGVAVEGVSPSYAEAIARALAPLRDDSRDRASTTGLPASVQWAELAGIALQGGEDDVSCILSRWAAGAGSTAALLGRSPDGAFEVDLARQGPHALVAGTTGSGKSELLQTLIASLALGNRPDELHLLLVDFKGGAAFGPCARLPHTVGMVTDLDGALVERALASLGAELRRRESVLASVGAKDVEDYRRIGATGLPRLVIVVDEFATLAEELPEFVGGLVGIAQRGRSLGVHLVLATQRPEGVVSADIRANTNLRLCLGVTRESESRDVIDSPAAATISRTTPGRAYARTGHADLTPFQTARVGGRRPALLTPDQEPAVSVLPAADLGEAVGQVAREEDPDEVTDLSLLVEACRAAALRLRLPASASPWLPPLPSLLTLDDLASPVDPLAGRVGRVSPLVFGVCDVPESQTRRPLALDLDLSSHLMVVGSPRSGRTTALRTLAGAVATTASPDDVHVYALDFGGGLGSLAALPHMGAVVGSDSPERIERLLGYLAGETTRRQALLAAQGHTGVTEQRACVGPSQRLPHLLLLLDRWESFVSTYQDLDAGRLLDVMYRLLREGPAAGLHIAMTADRSGLVGRVSSLIGDRLVLRLADRSDYACAGLPARSIPDELPPGRGWSTSAAPQVAQVALLDADPSGPAQTAALLARAGQPATRCLPHRIEPLPTDVSLWSLPSAKPGLVTLGVGGDELDPVTVDLRHGGFVIAGPPRSGRSTALLSIARQLQAEGRSVVALAPRTSPLQALAACHTDPQASYDVEALLSTADAVVIDDAELLVDSPIGYLLERTVREMRDRGMIVAAAGTTDDLVTGYRGFVVDLRRARTGVLLSPQSPGDGDLFGVRLSRGVGVGGVQPGRGLLCSHGGVLPLQLAVPEDRVTD